MTVSRFLLATTGINAGSLFVLGKSTMLGRSPEVAIRVMDPLVSREHACLEPDHRGNMVLCDLSSTNGTYVHGKRIVRRALRSGQRFRIGHSEFLFGEVSGEGVDTEALQRAADIVSVQGVRATTLIDEGLQTLRPRLDQSACDTEVVPSEGTTDAPPSGEDCTDPLHELAKWRGWPHCPACGRPIEP